MHLSLCELHISVVPDVQAKVATEYVARQPEAAGADVTVAVQDWLAAGNEVDAEAAFDVGYDYTCAPSPSRLPNCSPALNCSSLSTWYPLSGIPLHSVCADAVSSPSNLFPRRTSSPNSSVRPAVVLSQTAFTQCHTSPACRFPVGRKHHASRTRRLALNAAGGPAQRPLHAGRHAPPRMHVSGYTPKQTPTTRAACAALRLSWC